MQYLYILSFLILNFTVASAFPFNPFSYIFSNDLSKRSPQNYPPYTLVAVGGDGVVTTITVSFTTIQWGGTLTTTDVAEPTNCDSQVTVTETVTKRRYKMIRTTTVTEQVVSTVYLQEPGKRTAAPQPAQTGWYIEGEDVQMVRPTEPARVR